MIGLTFAGRFIVAACFLNGFASVDGFEPCHGVAAAAYDDLLAAPRPVNELFRMDFRLGDGNEHRLVH